jgi:hypothetical protein
MNQEVHDRIKFFISKKDKDEAIARRIKTRLELYGANQLVFFASEDIPKGSDWFDWIRMRLKESDLLILIFTDPSASWDWCLYEVGLFTPLSEELRKPIVCLHATGTEPPSPLKYLQAVKAESAKMKEFLRDLFGTNTIIRTETPINSPFAQNEEELTAVSEFICSELRQTGDPDRVYYNRFFKLFINSSELDPKKIHPEAKLQADRLSMEVFGLQHKPPGGGLWTWRKIEDKMRGQHNDSWIDDLAKAVYAASEGEVLRPISGLVTSLTSGKVYRPNVNRRDRADDGSLTLKIILVHQPRERKEVTLPVGHDETS